MSSGVAPTTTQSRSPAGRQQGVAHRAAHDIDPQALGCGVLRHGSVVLSAPRARPAQPLLQGLRLAAEHGRVIDGVRHHVLDVGARLVERMVSAKIAPSTGCVKVERQLRPPRAGVVTGAGQHLRTVQIAQHHVQIVGAQLGVGVEIVDAGGREIGHADLARDPFCGRRHQLHQARGAHVRARVHDEARFLADQAVDPGRVQRDGVGLGRDAALEGRDEALAEIEFSVRSEVLTTRS